MKIFLFGIKIMYKKVAYKLYAVVLQSLNKQKTQPIFTDLLMQL